jgi:hypothetical protein
MGIQNLNASNALFMSVLNDVNRKAKIATESDQQKAREAFYKSERSCYNAAENMMDKHLERVAKSAKEQAEYRKKKSVADRARQEADRQRNFNEDILIERINHQNMLEETRVRELNRNELLKYRAFGE